jgi:pSer/pThr/pTyr-binding forkhead associated (FHA) protein
LVGKNQQWILSKSEITLGRETGCDVQLPGEEFAMVSRFHATVRVEEDGCFVEDANSPNGTFLNGKRIQREKLSPADVIKLGKDGPQVKVRFVPPAPEPVIPATIAGASAQLAFKQSSMKAASASDTVAAPSAREDSNNLELALLERKLDGMRKLLSVVVGLIVALGAIVIYQGYIISQNQDTLLQMRRQATDAVAQFAPTLDKKIGDFQKRTDEMQHMVEGFDGKMKQVQDEFIHRMEKELPASMDRYVQSKIDEVKGGVRRQLK